MIDSINFAGGLQRRGGWRVDQVMLAEDPMKSIVFAALALVSFGTVAESPALAQSGGPYRGNQIELGTMPEAGSQVVPGGGGGQSANFRNQAQSPIPATREEWRSKPGDTQPPIRDVHPVPGKPLPPKSVR
ncbi:hypothetical protein [Reyranella sp.]|uniref:hypothetical protein n=1 Tax=Reyranella sp. TaxID=1929291 RepID=UPI0027321B11|nr:hypothetical protein [Reyranella sp.]MDP2375806.1 hypothetical protein [Reyranella sp.]